MHRLQIRPNSAQLGGIPYHSPKLYPGPCNSVGMRPRTDRHTRAWPQYISRRLRLTRNVIMLHIVHTLYIHVYNDNRKIFNYHEFIERGPGWLRQWQTTGSSNWTCYKLFRFERPYCYFRLSVVVAVIWEHFFELAVVGKLHFVSTNKRILILDLICNISQRDHEISPV